MRKNLSILILALVAILGTQSAKAWGTFGHGAIAYVAEQHLTPKAKAECRRYLKHTVPFYASWMDHWRAVPPFHPTNNWHGFSATADGQVNWEKGEGKSMGQLHKIMKEMGDGNYKNLSDLYAAKLVATYPLWKGNLTLGSEFNAVVRTNRYYNPEGLFAEDDSKFNEQDASAFVEYGRSFGNVDATVGLRYEYIDFDYYEYQVRIDEQSRVFHNLFPSFCITVPIKKVQTQLSYSMDIRRPWYGALSNNMMYMNKIFS